MTPVTSLTSCAGCVSKPSPLHSALPEPLRAIPRHRAALRVRSRPCRNITQPRKQGTARISAANDDITTSSPANIRFQEADYESPFQYTGYFIPSESEANGPAVQACGLDRAYPRDFLFGRGVLMQAPALAVPALADCPRISTDGQSIWLEEGANQRLVTSDAHGVLLPSWFGDRIAYARQRVDGQGFPVTEVVIVKQNGEQTRTEGEALRIHPQTGTIEAALPGDGESDGCAQ